VRLWEFLLQNRAEVFALALEHISLVGLSTGIATLLGVPLGILLTRFSFLSRPVLGFANVMQTVPSLALFGFLIPVNLYLFGVRVVGGIGAQTAIVALILYALLPIIRNTYIGMINIDPFIREAGRAMGMTGKQLLFRVEIPLSLGVILAGVRVAAVISVGTATIAAAIDAGGLGRYIFRGLRMNDNILVLAGAVPAAIMALSADFLLGSLEGLIASGITPKTKKLGIAGAILVLGVTAVLWAVGLQGPASRTRQIQVGSKDFTEQLILGEIVAQAVESRTGMSVGRRFDLGGNLAHQALVAGEVDAYVEYTGTALTAILGEPPAADSREVYQTVKREYGRKFDVEWTEPLGFNNTFAILIRGEEARRLNLKTISEAAPFSRQWRAGFGQDFMSRPDGYAGFARTYGLRFVELPREMDLSLTYRALAEKQVDLIAGNSTDGMIARYNLFHLEDDLHYFPPYDAAPVIRRETLKRYPEVREALRSLGGVISVVEMRRMNFQIDGEHRPIKEVVREFLRGKGLDRSSQAGRDGAPTPGAHKQEPRQIPLS
jgi:osmoprotectant transport system permease protein